MECRSVIILFSYQTDPLYNFLANLSLPGLVALDLTTLLDVRQVRNIPLEASLDLSLVTHTSRLGETYLQVWVSWQLGRPGELRLVVEEEEEQLKYQRVNLRKEQGVHLL